MRDWVYLFFKFLGKMMIFFQIFSKKDDFFMVKNDDFLKVSQKKMPFNFSKMGKMIIFQIIAKNDLVSLAYFMVLPKPSLNRGKKSYFSLCRSVVVLQCRDTGKSTYIIRRNETS